MYRECLDALDPVDRFVFIARYECGWTRLRIGEETGLPEGTARYREDRARSVIAACLRARGLRPEAFGGDATGEDVC